MSERKKPGIIPRSVMQIDERGRAMPFDNATEAADAAGVERHTMARWVGDGKEHRGFRWEYEQTRGMEG